MKRLNKTETPIFVRKVTFDLLVDIWAVSCENVSSGICGQRMPRSFAQSDQGLHCPLTESLDTTEYTNGEHSLRKCAGLSEFMHFAYVKGTFSFDAANINTVEPQ